MKEIWQLLGEGEPKKRKGLMVQAAMSLGALAAAKIVIIIAPLLFKEGVDALSVHGSEDVAGAIGLFVGYVAARLLSSLFAEIRDLIFMRVSQPCSRLMAIETINQLYHRALAFHRLSRTGALGRIIDRGVNGVETFLTLVVFNVLPSIFEVVALSLVFLWLFDFKFFGLLLTSITFYVVCTVVLVRRQAETRRRLNEADNDAHAKLVDALGNIETVISHAAEQYEASQVDASLGRHQAAATKNQQQMSLLNIAQTAIVSITLGAGLLLAISDLASGRITIGDVVAINMYLVQAFDPLGFFGYAYRHLQSGLVDIDGMLHLLRSARHSERATASKVMLNPRTGTISFRNVRFAYDSERPIVDNLNADISGGSFVAIVGESGVGKSTVVRLLLGLLQADQGYICIDDQRLSDVDPTSVRACIGVVSQEVMLFHDSIAYNIGYAFPQATSADIEAAAAAACIHDQIAALPNGYATLVGEHGLRLSGGERQRISIARALLRKSRVLILDEATASLDYITERRILENLRHARNGLTTIMVTHRLTATRNADRIFLLADGCVAESGNHEELLAQEGAYADLWRQQERRSGEPA